MHKQPRFPWWFSLLVTTPTVICTTTTACFTRALDFLLCIWQVPILIEIKFTNIWALGLFEKMTIVYLIMIPQLSWKFLQFFFLDCKFFLLLSCQIPQLLLALKLPNWLSASTIRLNKVHSFWFIEHLFLNPFLLRCFGTIEDLEKLSSSL